MVLNNIILILILILLSNTFIVLLSLNKINRIKTGSYNKNMEQLCDGLCDDLINVVTTKQPFSEDPCKQYWLAIAGGPGAGKSTISSLICEKLNNKGFESIVLPMDGYHYSRTQLQEIANSNSETSYDELLTRRGAEWTFDAELFVKDLSNAKLNGVASLPVYSRQKSDPVSNGVILKKSHRIVIIEGNYILNWDQERWSGLKELFDEKWYISCIDMKTQRERLIYRHLETWTSEKDRLWGIGKNGGAEKKADSNDVLNAQFVDEYSKKYADRIIINI